jgi:hypothetical protein
MKLREISKELGVDSEQFDKCLQIKHYRIGYLAA